MKTSHISYPTHNQGDTHSFASFLGGFLLNGFWLVSMIMTWQRVMHDKLHGITYLPIQYLGLGVLGFVFIVLFPAINLAALLYFRRVRSPMSTGLLVTFLAVPPVLLLTLALYALAH